MNILFIFVKYYFKFVYFSLGFALILQRHDGTVQTNLF